MCFVLNFVLELKYLTTSPFIVFFQKSEDFFLSLKINTFFEVLILIDFHTQNHFSQILGKKEIGTLLKHNYRAK